MAAHLHVSVHSHEKAEKEQNSGNEGDGAEQIFDVLAMQQFGRRWQLW